MHGFAMHAHRSRAVPRRHLVWLLWLALLLPVAQAAASWHALSHALPDAGSADELADALRPRLANQDVIFMHNVTSMHFHLALTEALWDLAEELKGVHEFQEDLREALGLESLYNESLGTVSTQYLYDRVKDRDRGAPKRPWE